MTRIEVEDRAQRIWGTKKFYFQPLSDDGWFVDETITNPRYRGRDSRIEGAYIPQNAIRVHMLDANGHPTCHDDCKAIEAALAG